MIDAAQSTFFVAAEEHRCAAVRTERADETNVAVGIAKRDQVFAEQAHAQRRAVVFGQGARDRRRQPIPAIEVAHRRSRAHAGQTFVVLRCQHRAAKDLPDGARPPGALVETPVGRGEGPRQHGEHARYCDRFDSARAHGGGGKQEGSERAERAAGESARDVERMLGERLG